MPDKKLSKKIYLILAYIRSERTAEHMAGGRVVAATRDAPTAATGPVTHARRVDKVDVEVQPEAVATWHGHWRASLGPTVMLLSLNSGEYRVCSSIYERHICDNNDGSVKNASDEGEALLCQVTL
jgi:hypothetical protein